MEQIKDEETNRSNQNHKILNFWKFIFLICFICKVWFLTILVKSKSLAICIRPHACWLGSNITKAKVLTSSRWDRRPIDLFLLVYFWLSQKTKEQWELPQEQRWLLDWFPENRLFWQFFFITLIDFVSITVFFKYRLTCPCGLLLTWSDLLRTLIETRTILPIVI